ncbi:MAG: hypothetical protein ACO1PN_07540 [Betaproteobacteria bacterium]
MRLTATRFASLIAATAFILGSATQSVFADTLAPLAPPTPMPSFMIPALNGGSGSDADLRNKVTIIRFWASW